MAAPTTYFPDESVEMHFTTGLNFGVQVTRFSNGRRQARKTIEKVLRSLEGRIPTTTLTKSSSVRTFLTNRFGPLQPFYIFAWPYQKLTGVVIDPSYDGVTSLPITLPFKDATVSQVYDDGVAVTSFDVDGLGAGGENRIWSILNVPADGSVITADIKGRERIPVEIVGNLIRVEHPLRRPQSSAETGAADYYILPLLEVP